MSAYPPPPPSTNGGHGSTTPSTQHQQHQQGPDGTQTQTHPAYVADAAAAAAAAAAAVAAAHHGLQALQAAVAAPPPGQSLSPVTPQHPSLQVPDASSYLGGGVSVGAPPAGAAANPKATRLRRACDMCSQRKVKCDETQPCRPCRELGVDCTFNRSMKRRGPPNKHAEAAKAAKQARLEPNI
ncbi:hypothetical protein C8A05DRAFT_34495, partial [Staphylotrichum tortipilum]